MNRFIGLLYFWFSGLSTGMILWGYHPTWFTVFLPFQAMALGALGYLRLKREFAS